MSAQSPFTFPLRGLGQGLYTYQLVVDDAFFATFPESPVTRANIDLELTIDRRTREMTLRFDFSGTVATTCDRCMAGIDLPIADRRQMIVKFVSGSELLEDEADLIFLDADTSLFNAATYVYELVLLAIPMIRTFDCREGEPPYPCDEEMLDRIDASVDSLSDADEDDADDDSDQASPWDVLKDLT